MEGFKKYRFNYKYKKSSVLKYNENTIYISNFNKYLCNIIDVWILN